MNIRKTTNTVFDGSAISIRDEIGAGDLGRIVALHGHVYDELDGFGLAFEAYVAKTISEYVLENECRGKIWLAECDGRLVGCAAIAERENNAGQLRWVLVDSECRGTGLGRRLVEDAINYCRQRGFNSVFLETTSGLSESMALYDKLGFKTVSETVVDLWDGPGDLITMELQLA